MLYALELGGKEKAILEQCIAQGSPIPERIAGAPDLETGLEFYYLAFNKLTTCRPITMGGEGPIPWTAYTIFCDRAGVQLTADEVEDFEYVMERMDDAYLKWRTEANKRNAPKESPRKVKKPR